MPEIYLPKAPIITDWITLQDISSPNSAMVQGPVSRLLIPAVPMIDWVIEIEFTLSATAGFGVGYFTLFNNNNVLASQTGITVQYTGEVYVEANKPLSEKIRIKPTSLQRQNASYVQNSYTIRNTVRGLNESSNATMTNARIRLIYTPA